MRTALQALFVLLPALYLGVTVLFAMSFAGDKAPPIARTRNWAFRLLLAVHLTLFAVHWSAAGGFAITTTWILVSAVAFTTAALYGLITWRTEQAPVGAIVLVVVGVMQLASSAFGDLAPVAREATNADRTRLLVHATTSVLATSALVLSGIYGFVHLLLFRQMRRRRFGPLFKELPHLQLLAKTTRRAALAGFLFMTVGVNVGIWQAHADAVEGFKYGDPQVLLTLAIWVHFGVIAFSRQIRGLSARRASFAAAAGLIVLILTLLLTLLPSATFHSFG